MDIFQIIEDLSKLSPRQGEKEIETAKYIENKIRQITGDIKVQRFPTRIPLVSSVYLKLDDHIIDCLGCSFETGNITTKDQITYNPQSDYISTPTYYQKPTVSISRLDANKLKYTTKIEGKVVIEKYSYISRNFLVGNVENPKTIIFTHYDSLGGGAIDNAGGVTLCLKLLTEDPKILSETLFLFAGNEELSYDFPDYWGFGYRQFEKEYPQFLRQAKQILVVDGVGLTSPEIIATELDNFLPLRYLKTFQNKIKVVSSNQQQVLKCYHCNEDTPDKISLECLNQSQNFISQMLE